MSVYVPPATSSSGSCSGSCQTETKLKYAYIGNYLGAHMLSTPSHRYAYLMWFVIVGVLLIGSAIYHIGMGDQTWVGAYWTKFAPKGRLIKLGRKPPKRVSVIIMPRKEHRQKPMPNGQSPLPPVPITPPKRYVFSLPSFDKVFLISWMVAVPTVLSLLGADYIDPNAAMFNMTASWPASTSAPTMVARRDKIQWGIGDYVHVDTLKANYGLPYHTWWTIGGRTGLMTNALTPFVVILALKQVPWAVMSTKLFGRYGFEKLSFLHKWGGRLVWVFAFAHTITWSVQLRLDDRNGEMVWGFIFLWPKFRWAFVAMGFLTLLVILSVGPIRTHYYEWFYVGHIVCALGFMVATAFHHPPLGPWMWASIAWWGCERLTRALKVAYINGIGFAGRKPAAHLTASGVSPSGTNSINAGFRSVVFKQAQKQVPYTYIPFHLVDGLHSGPGRNHPRFHQATVAGVGHHHQPSATLYEDSLDSSGIPYGHTKSSTVNTYASERPTHSDYNACQAPVPGEEEEWDLDENGDKVRKRPSRRYSPVSELIGDYTTGPGTNIQANYNSGTPVAEGGHGGDMEGNCPLKSSSSNEDSTDLGFKMYYDGMPTRSISHHTGAMTGSFEHESGPTSSTDYYVSHDAHFRSHFNGGGTQDFELADRNVPAPQHASQMGLAPRPALPADVAAIIKPGFAFAQVLPGKTLRLTLTTPNRISWKPGQWVYLNIPGVCGWQSHPFTIASAHGAHLPLSTTLAKSSVYADLESGAARKDKVKSEERTLVILIRVRKGFTLKLWEYVKKHRHRQLMAATTTQQLGQCPSTQAILPVAFGKSSTGVHLRAIVDGPYGSTERVRWGVHSTVVLICGGSGISFGIAVLEHLCACLQEVNATGKTIRGGKNFCVKRIRFVWICREFSHLQWVASALRRCIEMIPPKQLQVDLYVTHINNMIAARPTRPNVRGQRSTSYSDTLNVGGRYPPGGPMTPHSLDGIISPYGAGSATPNGVEPESKGGQGRVFAQPAYIGGKEGEEIQMEPNDFTEFDDEDMAEPDADEMAINTRIRAEGKLRRAYTRKATLKRKGRREASQASEPMASGGENDSRDCNLNTQDGLTMAAQNAMFSGTIEPGPFLRGAQQHQQRQQYRAAHQFFHANILPPGMERTYPSSFGAQGAVDPYEGHGFNTPGSDSCIPPAWESSYRGSSRSETGQSESMDSDLSTPFGHKVVDSFDSLAGRSRSSAHLLETDLGENAGGGLDSAIDLDEEEEQDLRIIAELAHTGHPRLDQIMSDEVRYAQGRTLVASCGPTNLSNLLRRIAVKYIDPAKSRKGDKRGEVNLCIESFEWGGS